jgi:hypothetical protein
MTRKSSGEKGVQEQLLTLVTTAVKKIDELAAGVQSLDKKVDLHIQETKFGFSRVEQTDQQQNKILEEHHQRSTELKRDNDLREQQIKKELEVLSRRLVRVEAPRKWLAMTKSLVLWLAAVLGAIVAIGGFARGFYEGLKLIKLIKGA